MNKFRKKNASFLSIFGTIFFDLMYYLLISVSIFQSLEFFFLDKEVQNSRNVICFVVFFFKKKLFSI